MKALSIRQPYAWAIASGFKPVENRTWRRDFHGPVLIHAGKKELVDDVDHVIRDIAAQTGVSGALIRNAYDQQKRLGGIVGFGVISKCVASHPSPWFRGPYGFVFERAQLIGFVPCPGQLGFFDVPAEIIHAIGGAEIARLIAGADE